MSVHKIYFLENNETGARYVGRARSFWSRLAEHVRKLKSGQHHATKLQRMWDRYPSMTSWTFGVLDEVVGLRRAKVAEARRILEVDEDMLLNAKIEYVVSEERREAIVEALQEGGRVTDIAKSFGVSNSFVSKVKHNYRSY
jgi:nitrogen regulatory protein PII